MAERATKAASRVPHKADAGPRMERIVRQNIPAAAIVPVIIAGIDAAILINTLDDGHVAEIARALHARLQYDDRGHFRRGRNHPAIGPGAIGPRPGIARPGHPVTCKRVVAHIGPICTLAKSKAIGAARSAAIILTAGWGIITATLLCNCRGSCRLLRYQAWIAAAAPKHVAYNLDRVKTMSAFITGRRYRHGRSKRNHQHQKCDGGADYPAASLWWVSRFAFFGIAANDNRLT